MHFLITGHTGFKGAWLTLMLRERGHTVSGISLEPLPASLFSTAKIHTLLEHDFRFDIRDATATRTAFSEARPEVVVHMAAQPLVRDSYRDPRYTFETNVNGTLNVLDATARTPGVHAQLIITTDKVYRNVGQIEGYKEDDPLGGDDPYSASKAMADLLTQAWTRSFPGVPTGIVRAGNVIGGGDVSPERLVPDLVRAFAEGRPAELRYPRAVRPWQHVLDCLNGYMLATSALLESQEGGIWNIGPNPESFLSVSEIADLACREWGDGASWVSATSDQLPEAEMLNLDASKARQGLGWTDRLSVQQALSWTMSMHRPEVRDTQTEAIRQLQTFETME